MVGAGDCAPALPPSMSVPTVTTLRRMMWIERWHGESPVAWWSLRGDGHANRGLAHHTLLRGGRLGAPARRARAARPRARLCRQRGADVRARPRAAGLRLRASLPPGAAGRLGPPVPPHPGAVGTQSAYPLAVGGTGAIAAALRCSRSAGHRGLVRVRYDAAARQAPQSGARPGPMVPAGRAGGALRPVRGQGVVVLRLPAGG